MKPGERPLLTAAAIQRRVDELGAEIAAYYGDVPFTMLVVLKGAIPFAADLMRAIGNAAMAVEYIRARSYDGAESTGEVRIMVPPEESLEGRHVLIVEDILDTGRTTRVILDHIEQQGAASCGVCVLLDKPARREVAVTADFCGFTIDNHFVVGYGLDFNERYRELPAVFVMERADETPETDASAAIEAALEPKVEEPFVWPAEEAAAGEAEAEPPTPATPDSGRSVETPSSDTEAERQAAQRARTRRRRGRRPPYR